MRDEHNWALNWESIQMDHHIRDFYRQSSDESPRGNFHKVIALHDAPDIDWELISAQVPRLSRGWYELSRLQTKDRIEFIRDYWLSKLPFRQGLAEAITRFFSSLDNLGIYITQQKWDDPFQVEMVYSLKGDSGFYRGGSPATEEDILRIKKHFSDYMLPLDYLAFLQIHDGFWKTTDCTGLTKSAKLDESYQKFQEMLSKFPPATTAGDPITPKSLIPFYESFGMPYYQCFWAEWYPEEEMGNVYYSGESKTIPDVKKGFGSENMAFPTFTDWLIFYLERVM